VGPEDWSEPLHAPTSGNSANDPQVKNPTAPRFRDKCFIIRNSKLEFAPSNQIRVLMAKLSGQGINDKTSRPQVVACDLD
jgi:hypothetical protein